MLLSEEVIVNACNRSKKHYENLGYKIYKRENVNGILQTPFDTKILVKVEDLPKSSETLVTVLCDHCKINMVSKRYVDYLKERKRSGFDTCYNCRTKNTEKTLMEKYGVINLFQLDWVKEKSKQTCLEKYNVEYSSQSPEIRDKIKKTNLKRYGVEYGSQTSQSKLKVSGKNHFRWKGGISSERSKIWHTKEYKEWRLNVFTKDNFTCQCCGDNKGGNLNAHHKYNFAEYIELRLDINNGTTLCKDCHDFRIIGSFHHTYGTRNNTPEQLEEYIKKRNIKEVV